MCLNYTTHSLIHSFEHLSIFTQNKNIISMKLLLFQPLLHVADVKKKMFPGLFSIYVNRRLLIGCLSVSGEFQVASIL